MKPETDRGDCFATAVDNIVQLTGPVISTVVYSIIATELGSNVPKSMVFIESITSVISIPPAELHSASTEDVLDFIVSGTTWI